MMFYKCSEKHFDFSYVKIKKKEQLLLKYIHKNCEYFAAASAKSVYLGNSNTGEISIYIMSICII